MYCYIPYENASQNEASPSVINNVGHVRGLEGFSYISLIAIQISKLFLNVNEHPVLKSMTKKLQTPFYHPDYYEYRAKYHTNEFCLGFDNVQSLLQPCMMMVVDKFDGHINILTTLQYSAIEKNIFPVDTFYVIF